jgi:hypothetical protein
MPRTILEELRRRIDYLKGISFRDAPTRLVGFLDWLEVEPVTNGILIQLRQQSNIEVVLQGCGHGIPPKTATPEDVARVGLFICEECKGYTSDAPSHLAGLLFGLSCDTSYNDFDYTFADAVSKYIDHFLRYLQEEAAKAPQYMSLDNTVKYRQDAFLTPEFTEMFPETSRLLRNLSKEMTVFLESENWFNIANSCRETLKQFSDELLSTLQIQKPDEVKAGDFKGVIRYALSQMMEKSRGRETLEGVSCSVWDYLQSLLHNNATTRAEAMRIYLWTGMVIAEVFSQVGIKSAAPLPGNT